MRGNGANISLLVISVAGVSSISASMFAPVHAGKRSKHTGTDAGDSGNTDDQEAFRDDVPANLPKRVSHEHSECEAERSGDLNQPSAVALGVLTSDHAAGEECPQGSQRGQQT